jgi:hypothetical protein
MFNTIARYSYAGDKSMSVTTHKQPPSANVKLRKELQDSGYTQDVINKIVEYYTGNQKGKTNGERRSC